MADLEDKLNDLESFQERLERLTRQRVDSEQDLLDTLRDNSNILADQTKSLNFQIREKNKLKSISRELVKIAESSYSTLQNELGLEKTKQTLYKNQQQVTKDINLLEQLKGKILLDNKELQADINQEIENQIKSAKELSLQLETIERLSDSVSKNFGVKTFGALSDITKAIPGLRKFSSPFEDAANASRQQASLNAQNNEILKTGKGLTQDKVKELGLENKFLDKNGKILAGTSAVARAQALNLKAGPSAFKTGLKTLGPALKKALGPVYLISELIQGIMQADKEVTELQKSMALTQMEAMGFRTELALAAADTGNINVTTEKLLKNFNALNQQFGFITNFSAETLATMTRLTDVIKISSESAGNLAAASLLTGKSFDENKNDILATSYELQRQSGVQFDLRQILEETGKVTGTVRANLGANPALIAEAVTEAKLFGGTLKDVAGAAEALVGFQSSIRAELEAELLTGRQLNLERARMAALTGDQATLARELKEQAGGFEDFTKMNVIQQQALAKSLGMQSDQLADILFQQEIQGKSARELRVAGREELAQRLEAQTAADKFNATVDKLKGLFSDVGTAFLPVLKVLGAAASLVGLIVGLVGDLLAMLGGDFDFSGTKAGVEGIVNSLFGANIDLGNDMISPGYGKRTLLGPEGAIALNNEDTIVAGTDLLPTTKPAPTTTQTTTVSPNMVVLEQKMDKLIAVVENALIPAVKQDKIFALDGKQFAVATAVSRS